MCRYSVQLKVCTRECNSPHTKSSPPTYTQVCANVLIRIDTHICAHKERRTRMGIHTHRDTHVIVPARTKDDHLTQSCQARFGVSQILSSQECDKQMWLSPE